MEPHYAHSFWYARRSTMYALSWDWIEPGR